MARSTILHPITIYPQTWRFRNGTNRTVVSQPDKQPMQQVSETVSLHILTAYNTQKTINTNMQIRSICQTQIFIHGWSSSGHS